MSARTRAIARRVDPTDGELDRLFRHMGKPVPHWLAESQTIWAEFSVRALNAYEQADKVEFLLRTIEIKDPRERELLLRARDLLKQFIDGSNLIDDLPKNTPKNFYRDKLRELSDQAAEIITPIFRHWEITGETPGNFTIRNMS